jgi:hypothetical protein
MCDYFQNRQDRETFVDFRFQKETAEEYASVHKKLFDYFIKLMKTPEGKLKLTNYHLTMLVADSLYGVPKDIDTAPISMFISDEARQLIAQFIEEEKDKIWHQTLYKIPVLAARYKLNEISQHDKNYT